MKLEATDNLATFRLKVREYRRFAGISQEALAKMLGLSASVLSHKLNGSDGLRLSGQEIKEILKILAETGGISRQAEVHDLLTLMNLKFAPADWQTQPFNELTPMSSVVVVPPAPAPAPVLTLNVAPIPAQPTPLIGREREVRQVCGILRQAGVRLLTLTGTGGTGKTRLSLRCATEIYEDFGDGVVFVPLADVSDAALVETAILHALGDAPNPDARLTDVIRERHMLLVLDNFEQLQTGAGKLGELLANAPRLKLLVTSRATLQIYGEHEFPVPPLSLPDVGEALPPDLLQYEAVRLFVERARAVRADFKLLPENAPAIVEICRRLDGLPLAIELAAARSKLFAPAALLERLTGSFGERFKLLTGAQNLPSRHQTLRNTIDWSYNALEPAEKTLFARLAVFAGGWTLEMLSICAENIADPLVVLEALVNKSLVQTQSDRFGMLETLREYALERLIASGELADLRCRHAEYFAVYVEKLEEDWRGANQARWLGEIEKIYPNLRYALDFTYDQAESDLAFRLGGALADFWAKRGYLPDARAWLEKTPLTIVAPDERQATILNRAGMLCRHLNDYARARALYETSLAFFRQTDDALGIATNLYNIGLTYFFEGDYPPARVLIEEGVALCRQIDHKRGIAIMLNALGAILLATGEYEMAEELLNHTLPIYEELHLQHSLPNYYLNMGISAMQQGKPAVARPYFEKSLTISHQIGNKVAHANNLLNFGALLTYTNEYVQAQAVLQEGYGLTKELGDAAMEASALKNLGRLALEQSDYSSARRYYDASLQIRLRLNNRIGIAEAYEGLARLAAIADKPKEAYKYLVEARNIRDTYGAKLPPVETVWYNPLLADLETIRHAVGAQSPDALPE